MWFRKITAGAFGPLLDASLEFGKALNVIYGPNESGKSTWHAALVTALCGHRHGSGRTAAERDFKRRRRPWDDPDRWRVALQLELDDGRIVEIDRDLHVPRTRVLDIGMGGREVTDDLMNQGSPDGAKWLGLNRTTFPITASVSQADLLSILGLGTRERKSERDALQECLARATAGGARGTAAGAIERIRRYATENVGLDRRNSRRPLRIAIDRVQKAETALSRTRSHHKEYVELARKVDRKRREVRDLENERNALEALQARYEAEELAKDLIERAGRLQEWERRFPDGDPQRLEELDTADLQIAIRGAREAPKPIKTDLDPQEILEGRLSALVQHEELADALESMETARGQAKKLEQEVERLEDWEERFSGADPHQQELMSFTDLATAVARCNSLPTPGFTDIDPLDILTERMSMLDDTPPKPCPRPGDVQRWVIPLRETPPPPRQELQEQIDHSRRTAASSKPRSSARRLTLPVGVGAAVAAATWVVASNLFFGIAAGVLAAGTLFLFGGATSRHHPVTSVDVESLKKRLSERQTFDTRVADAQRLLREWDLPSDPDAAIAEFYNRERAWSEHAIERRRIEELITRRRRFDEEDIQRQGDREKAFGDLRSIVGRYGADAGGDEGQVLGEAMFLLDDRERVARQRQDDVADWGRFQEALAGRSLEEWRLDAASARQAADQAARKAGNLARAIGDKVLGREEISAERERINELIFRRRRLDEEQERRHRARQQAFEKMRRVVALHRGKGASNENGILESADALLKDLERSTVQRRTAIAEWGRFQEALAGHSTKEWHARAAQACRRAEEARQKAEHLTDNLNTEEPDSNDISWAMEKNDGLLQAARSEASWTAGQIEQIDTDRVDVAAARAARDEAQNELDRVRRLEATLNTATEYLQQAAERAHRLLAPRLEAPMEEQLPIITGGRYVGALVDPETLEVRMRHRGGAIREAALLSHGTAEQVYLLLRMILAQVLTDQHQRCPVLLDDPTVHADRSRKEQVLEYLYQTSVDHQVILFTQDLSVLRWAQGHRSDRNIELIQLPGPDLG